MPENVKFNIHCIYSLFEECRPYVLISDVMASIRKEKIPKRWYTRPCRLELNELRCYWQSQMLHCKIRITLASEVFHKKILCFAKASEVFEGIVIFLLNVPHVFWYFQTKKKKVIDTVCLTSPCGSLAKIWGVTKNRYGHNFQIIGSTMNQRLVIV